MSLDPTLLELQCAVNARNAATRRERNYWDFFGYFLGRIRLGIWSLN